MYEIRFIARAKMKAYMIGLYQNGKELSEDEVSELKDCEYGQSQVVEMMNIV
ncbi:hypothetical protein [Ehrlichia japonica]|uniref:Uncharacterized protein n=1 Tax=Ehrlichia japonica TaxID=391036 RepID=X5H1Q4_9RICK|nr:hypothetical protein [Ehrlichia japonica]AHX04784.1 hypothetical protein EHF_0229 [Ehrlichia japonica]